MFAIVATSGKQFRVSEGDRIVVDRVAVGVGQQVRLESVLLVGGEGQPVVGTPYVSGALVEATVLSHRAGDKIIVFRYKQKKRERRKMGHRQLLTELKIGAIRRPEGEPPPPEPTPATPRHAATRARKRSEQTEKGGTQ